MPLLLKVNDYPIQRVAFYSGQKPGEKERHAQCRSVRIENRMRSKRFENQSNYTESIGQPFPFISLFS